MKKCNVLTVVFAAAFPVLSPGCGLFEELDDNVDVPTDTDGGTEVCEALVENTECPPPFTSVLSVNIEDGDVTWVDDPGASIGPIDIGVDGVAYIAGGNAECSVACYASPSATCAHFGGTLCEAGECSNCIIDGSAEDCNCLAGICNGVAVPDSCYPDGDGEDDGVGDSSGDSGSGGADSGSSGADSGSGGGDDAGDVSGGVFPTRPISLNPETVLWTTPERLERIQQNVSGVVVTRVCDAWDPSAAVGSWLGDPFVSRADLQRTLDSAGAFLAECDELRVKLVEDGILLSSVQSGTLADLLGFRKGDVLLDLNGVPATDLLGLRSEFARVGEDSAGVGVVSFRRANLVRSRTIRVKG